MTFHAGAAVLVAAGYDKARRPAATAAMLLRWIPSLRRPQAMARLLSVGEVALGLAGLVVGSRRPAPHRSGTTRRGIRRPGRGAPAATRHRLWLPRFRIESARPPARRHERTVRAGVRRRCGVARRLGERSQRRRRRGPDVGAVPRRSADGGAARAGDACRGDSWAHRWARRSWAPPRSSPRWTTCSGRPPRTQRSVGRRACAGPGTRSSAARSPA